jgi:flagellar motor switch protein FliN/FliY
LRHGIVAPVRTAGEDGEVSAVSGVNVEISVILGKTMMPIHQLLKMGRGAVIELDSNVDDPVTIYANNRLIARGEVMVSGENVAVTITENELTTEI